MTAEAVFYLVLILGPVGPVTQCAILVTAMIDRLSLGR